jgi:hypothetical protein
MVPYFKPDLFDEQRDKSVRELTAASLKVRTYGQHSQ